MTEFTVMELKVWPLPTVSTVLIEVLTVNRKDVLTNLQGNNFITNNTHIWIHTVSLVVLTLLCILPSSELGNAKNL